MKTNQNQSASLDSRDGAFPDLFTGALKAQVCAAGRKALELQLSISPECKTDGTLVTAADQAIEADLRSFLTARDPSCQVLGEEDMAAFEPGRDTGFDFSRRTWVIDPIDGTALFAYRMPGWGVSLGLMEDGRMKDGLVLFPSAVPGASSLIVGGKGSGASRVWFDLYGSEEFLVEDAGRPWTRSGTFEPRYPVVPGFPGLLGISQTLAKNALYDGPHTILNTASCVNSFLHLMAGSLVGYCAKVKLWDLAAMWPLAYRLGIRACDIHGNPMDLGLDTSVWHVDVSKKSYLAQTSHILCYHPDRMDAKEFWKNLHWRNGIVL